MHQPGYPPVPVSTAVSRPTWTLAGPLFGTLLAGLQFTLPFGLMTDLQRDLHASAAAVLVLIAGYAIAALPGLGMGYLLGRRLATLGALLGLFLMLAGGAAGAFADGVAVLTAGRLAAGFGAGLVAGVAVSIAARTRSGPIGLFTGLAALAGAVAGPAVGLIADRALGWRPVFLLPEPFVLLALAVTAVTGIVLLAQPRPGPGARPH